MVPGEAGDPCRPDPAPDRPARGSADPRDRLRDGPQPRHAQALRPGRRDRDRPRRPGHRRQAPRPRGDGLAAARAHRCRGPCLRSGRDPRRARACRGGSRGAGEHRPQAPPRRPDPHRRSGPSLDVERPRRRQPSQAPLHAQDPQGGRRRGRTEARDDELVQQPALPARGRRPLRRQGAQEGGQRRQAAAGAAQRIVPGDLRPRTLRDRPAALAARSFAGGDRLRLVEATCPKVGSPPAWPAISATM